MTTPALQTIDRPAHRQARSLASLIAEIDALSRHAFQIAFDAVHETRVRIEEPAEMAAEPFLLRQAQVPADGWLDSMHTLGLPVLRLRFLAAPGQPLVMSRVLTPGDVRMLDCAIRQQASTRAVARMRGDLIIGLRQSPSISGQFEIRLHGVSTLGNPDRVALQRCVEDWVEMRRWWFAGIAALAVVPNLDGKISRSGPVAVRCADIVDLLGRRPRRS